MVLIPHLPICIEYVYSNATDYKISTFTNNPRTKHSFVHVILERRHLFVLNNQTNILKIRMRSCFTINNSKVIKKIRFRRVCDILSPKHDLHVCEIIHSVIGGVVNIRVQSVVKVCFNWTSLSLPNLQNEFHETKTSKVFMIKLQYADTNFIILFYHFTVFYL